MAEFTQGGVELIVKGSSKFLSDLGKANSTLVGFGKSALKAAAVATTAFAGVVTGIGVAGVKAAVDFESAFAGVIKTTDGLVDEMGNLTESGETLQQGFRDLAKEVPVSVEELLAIGELGGQLGIAEENLLDFTRTIAGVGEATNLTTEEAAQGFAQIANIMGTPQGEIENMASSVVALGNNFATTERDVFNFAQRIAGAGKIAGLSEAQVFGIGAAFSSVGIEAEAGGTAVQKVLLGINQSVLEGGDTLEVFANTAGQSADDFAVLWEKDAGAAFTEFVSGLGDAGDDAIAILDALDLKDQRLVRSFLSLAGAGDLLSETLGTSTEAFEENSALTTEVQNRYRTTEAQFQLLKNTLKDVGITIGQALLPFVNQLLQMAMPLISELGQRLPGLLNGVLIPAIQTAAQWFGQIANAVGLLIMRLQTRGIGEIFTIFDDGTTILSAFFEDLGIGTETAQLFGQAIARIGQFVTETVIPAIAILAAWLGENLPIAIQAISTFLTETLFPTIQQLATWLGENLPIAIQALSTFWTETLQPALTTVWAFINESILPALGDLAAFLGRVLPPIIQEVGGFLLDVFGNVVRWFRSNWPVIQQTFESVISAIQQFWNAHGQNIIDTITGAWETAKNSVETAINLIQGIVSTVLQIINGDWEGAWETIKATAATVWEGIKRNIAIVLYTLTNSIIPIALDAILSIFKRIWRLIVAAVEEAWGNLKGIVNEGGRLIRTLIEFALDKVFTFFENIWNDIKTTVETAWEDIVAFVDGGMQDVLSAISGVAGDLIEAGKAIVQNVWNGIKEKWGELEGWFKARLQDLADLLPFSEPKDASSPLRGLGKSGAAIIGNILDGMQSAERRWSDVVISIGETIGRNLTDSLIATITENLEEGQVLSSAILEGLFGLGGTLGGIGGGFASLIQNRIIDPLEENLARMEEKADGLTEAYESQLDALDKTKKALIDSGNLTERQAAGINTAADAARFLTNAIVSGNEEQERTARQLFNIFMAMQDIQHERQITGEEMADTEAQILAQQRELEALEQRRQTLRFMEEQFKLLQLIQQHGLDPEEILGGMTLGIGASMGDLLDAMTEAMTQIIRQANEELQIQSPSRVFMDIGAQVMAGLAEGIMGAAQMPALATAAATQQVLVAPAAATSGAGGGDNVVNLNMSNTINNGMDLRTFESRVMRVVQQATRGNR